MMRVRSLLIVLISVLASMFLVLLAYILFVAFPAVAETGDAQLQVWLGPQGARFGYMLIAALIAASYIWVTVYGTRGQEAAAAYPWLAGALVGGIAGLVYVSLAVVAGWLAWQNPLFLFGLILVAAPVVAGNRVGRATGQARSAAVGGFWCGLALAQVVATGWAVRDLVLASWLAHSVWVGETFRDPPCSMGGTILAACEIGDDLGGLAIQLLTLPLLSAGLGALASLPWRAATAPQAQVGPGWSWAVAAPVVFSVVMVVVLTVEVTFTFW
jgi:hypothetical protein